MKFVQSIEKKLLNKDRIVIEWRYVVEAKVFFDNLFTSFSVVVNTDTF